jgi:hypothetical protein
MMRSLKSRKGSASALIILVITVLVMLGVLSLVTAAADRRLAEKRASWQQEYYQIDARAEQVLAKLNIMLSNYSISHNASGKPDEALVDEIMAWLTEQNVHEAAVELVQNNVIISFVVGDVSSDKTVQLLDIELHVESTDKNRLAAIPDKWLQRQSERPITDETGVIWIPD